MDRRHFLQLMVAAPVILSMPLNAEIIASEPDSHVAQLQRVSELLTGRRGLDANITARLGALLCQQDKNFPAHLTRLFSNLTTLKSDDRERLVASLDDQDVKTALSIVSPWYLGYTGQPSTVKAVDDAHFVTFLSALMYEPTRNHTLRPSYARSGQDYWAEVPAGVTAPAMPAAIRDWGDRSPAAANHIREPEAPWLLMVQGKASTLAEAEAMIAKQ